jgi:hypothetical protein
MNIILIVHLVLAIVELFVLSPMNAIGDFISCAILYCGLYSVNFCQVLFYMVFCMYDSFQLFVTLGLMVQTGSYAAKQSKDAPVSMGFVIGFSVTMFLFYIIAVYFSFQTYKEFKAMHQEQLGDIESLNAQQNPISYGACKLGRVSMTSILVNAATGTTPAQNSGGSRRGGSESPRSNG